MTMTKLQFPKNKGQVSLVVLLVAAVITTLGLSLSKKTVLETKIDIDDELQKQAFNTAESGIEYYLGTGTTTALGKSVYTSTDGKTRAEITIEDVGNTTTIDFNELTPPGGYQYFWLVGHDGDGEINEAENYAGGMVNVCVNNSYSEKMAINYYYKEAGSYKVKRLMGFSDIAVGGGDQCEEITLVVGATSMLITASPLMTSGGVNIKLKGTANFPSQGRLVTAVGQAGDLSNNAIKSRVKTLDRYQVLPFMLEPLSAKGVVGP
jgi:Tfp pilus assembly protein PilX